MKAIKTSQVQILSDIMLTFKIDRLIDRYELNRKLMNRMSQLGIDADKQMDKQ